MAETYLGAPLEDVYRAYTGLAEFVLGKVANLVFTDVRPCVLGLGKLGGCELNYSSDVDLVFVAAEPCDPEALGRAIQAYVGRLREGGPEEFLYRTDLRLRPHGDHGSLFLTRADFLAYYRSEAEAWEFQALLKARPVAGDFATGELVREALGDLVYAGPWPAARLEEIRKVKRRYEAEVRARGEEETHIKLGPGGIRDAEFAVQMLQIRHGPGLPHLRSTNTFEAFRALEASAILAPEDGAALREAYEFLRRVENRLQIFENRQTFNLPTDPRRLRWLARSMGFDDGPAAKAEDRFLGRLSKVRRRCREVFERIFFGPA
jgi:glutamate-ammonia-ligase adenylyltransferase